jgi:hypothetical protein
MNKEYIIAEGDLIILNVDGRMQKYIVFIKESPLQAELRNVDKNGTPLTIYIAERYKTAPQPIDNELLNKKQ